MPATSEASSQGQQDIHAISIAIIGMVCLSVAMGIGRFAFTPLLPMMLQEGLIDLRSASGLATANYAGYWLGATLCAFQPLIWARWKGAPSLVQTDILKFGLVSTAVLTSAMSLNFAWVWPIARFGAGLASALVFVYTSGWCLSRLSELGSPRLAGFIYTGPGLGIVVTGLAASAMVVPGWKAAAGWLFFGAIAAVLTLLIWTPVRGEARLSAAAPVQAFKSGKGIFILSIAYGLAGFGYIISATFLPVIARQILPASIWLNMFWPIFGLAIILGALITTRFPMHWDRRLLLIGSYLLQATGIVMGIWFPTLIGLAVGSLMVGLPVTALTLFGMQEVRRLKPENAPPFMGLLTTIYAIFQMAGPIFVAYVLGHSSDPKIGFTISLYAAAASLLLGVFLYVLMIYVEER